MMLEVLLRRVRAAEAFGGRAVRHEVEQRLPGRANDRDDLRARFRGGDGRGAVFVNVAARDDDVEQRRFALRNARQPFLAFFTPSTRYAQANALRSAAPFRSPPHPAHPRIERA